MISEESCDTEDWSNDAEKSALHHINKLHFTIHLNGNNQINTDLESISDYFQNLNDPKLA